MDRFDIAFGGCLVSLSALESERSAERGIEHRLEDKIESATEKITQNSTSAIMMELGPKFEELMEAVKKR